MSWYLTVGPRGPNATGFVLGSDSTPRGIPTAFWQSTRSARVLAKWCSWLASAAIIVMVALLIVAPTWATSGPVVIRLLYGTSIVVSLIAPWATRKHWAQKLFDEIEETDFRICLTCGYLLIGMGDACICPECGETFSHSASRREWREWRTRCRF